MPEAPTPLDAIPISGSAKLLGWKLMDMDIEKGEITIGFAGTPEFCNPVGFVQGGMLVAMMDDTMGPAVFTHSGGTKMTSSVDIHAHFLRPVPTGSITVKARVVRLGRTMAFTEAELFDAAGKLCARASSSAQIADFAPHTSPSGEDRHA